jgi:hypothetical protein
MCPPSPISHIPNSLSARARRPSRYPEPRLNRRLRGPDRQPCTLELPHGESPMAARTRLAPRSACARRSCGHGLQ